MLKQKAAILCMLLSSLSLLVVLYVIHGWLISVTGWRDGLNPIPAEYIGYLFSSCLLELCSSMGTACSSASPRVCIHPQVQVLVSMQKWGRRTCLLEHGAMQFCSVISSYVRLTSDEHRIGSGVDGVARNRCPGRDWTLPKFRCSALLVRRTVGQIGNEEPAVSSIGILLRGFLFTKLQGVTSHKTVNVILIAVRSFWSFLCYLNIISWSRFRQNIPLLLAVTLGTKWSVH
jgi:hypothetical protein